MTHKYLKTYPPLHLYVSHLIQKILLTSEELEVDYIEAFISNVLITKSTIEESHLSLEINYQNSYSDFLANIQSGTYKTDRFLLYITNQVSGGNMSTLDIDIVYIHESDLRINLMGVKDYSLDTQIESYFENILLLKTSRYNIEPLSCDSLDEAITLQMKIFKLTNKYEKQTLRASLDKQNNQEVYANSFITTMHYWIMKDTSNNNIIGLTGLYQEPTDPKDTCWLGWFCVDTAYRGKGYGKVLFDFTINKAKEKGQKHLQIYTYDSKEFSAAISMYKNMGFTEYTPGRSVINKDMYFKKFIGIDNA